MDHSLVVSLVEMMADLKAEWMAVAMDVHLESLSVVLWADSMVVLMAYLKAALMVVY